MRTNESEQAWRPRCLWHAEGPQNTHWKDAIERWRHHPDAKLGVTITVSGVRQVVIFCLSCNNQMSTAVPHHMVKCDIDDLPVFRDRRDPNPCEACGATTGTEVHHWAPWHLFGDEAANWPTSFLCRSCHRRWHEVTRTGSYYVATA